MNFLQLTLAIQDIEMYLDELKSSNKIEEFLIQTNPVSVLSNNAPLKELVIVGVSVRISTDRVTHHPFFIQPEKLALKIFLDGLKANEDRVIRKEEVVC